MLSQERAIAIATVKIIPDTRNVGAACPNGEALEIAAATLRRGADFIGGGMLSLANMAPVGSPFCEGAYWPKVVGNALRELDRFLSLLIDEVAHAIGLPDAERRHLARQRNTANKLRTVYAALGLASPHHDRLRAMVRCGACLFYCAGIASRPDIRGGGAMTVAWPASFTPSSRSVQIPMGDRLIVNLADLLDIASFFSRAAADLLEAGGPPTRYLNEGWRSASTMR